MSGGSYDYAYLHVERMAEEMKKDTPLRRAFSAHLRKVANAMQSIEWLDSYDTSREDEAAIAACMAPGVVAEQAVADLKKAIQDATDALVKLGVVVTTNEELQERNRKLAAEVGRLRRGYEMVVDELARVTNESGRRNRDCSGTWQGVTW